MDTTTQPTHLRGVPILAGVTAMLALALAGCSTGAAPSSSADEWMFLTTGQDSDLVLSGGAELDGTSLALDGATGYATTPAPADFDTTASFTASAWVSVGEGMAPYSAALSQIGDVAASFYLGWTEGAFSFSMKDADTNDEGHTTRAVADAGATDPDAWVHLAGVFDADAGTIALYVDGEEAAVSDFDAPIRVEGDLVFGGAQAHSAPSDFWDGAVTGVTLTDAGLDAASVAASMDDTRPSGDPPVHDGADPSTYGDGILNGTWDAPLTDESFIADVENEAGLGPLSAMRLGFDEAEWWLGFVFGDEVWEVGGIPEGDNGVFTIDGESLTTDNGSALVTYAWTLEGDDLTLVVTDCRAGGAVCEDIDDVRLVTERTYTRSGTDASS
ncbi:MAG: LamG-like jellyroll fold domain-containing protein [Microbacterium sp.]